MQTREHPHHRHEPNRFGVIPTAERLHAHRGFNGEGVCIAFLDSGFYPHPDLAGPEPRVVSYVDITPEQSPFASSSPESWRWHGTQTSVTAAGNGRLSESIYRGIACKSDLCLVKISQNGQITEDNIVRGIEWVRENRVRYGIRILNISLGGDKDVACSESAIDQAAERAISEGIVVVAAAGNSGNEGRHSIPPANSPGVITVGGYSDGNSLDQDRRRLYHSNFGATSDGTVKPEIIAPAMFVAAPILPNTAFYRQAEALSQLADCPDYRIAQLLGRLRQYVPQLADGERDPEIIRARVEAALRDQRIVAAHYQHVDGTSFAAPLVSSVIAQMIEANPQLTPSVIKDILLKTAERIAAAPALRQGYGVLNAGRAVAMALGEVHVSAELRNVKLDDDRFKFTYHDDEAELVCLAGTFNNWDPNALHFKKTSSGLWRAELMKPAPGRYEYKFVINGRTWVEDPGNSLKTPDTVGGLNSVLVVQ